MNKTTKQFQLLLFLAITAAAAWFDQFTKKWALANLGDHEPVPLIEGVLEFLRIENRGAAFGILQGQMSFFYIISAVVGVVILYVLLKLPCEKKYFPLLITLSFIAAGAVGNLIDRTFRKSVVDFIYFKPIDFPVFNVADIYVTTATAVMMLLVLFYYQDEDFDFLKRSRQK
ncbi:MAG: signal peptidase II [Stomatobaculum sp.]|nr:signal peptidase II [Stomatobaculum sp.]